MEQVLARHPGAGRLGRSRLIKAVAVVRDLFFVARIRETARLVGTPLVFARTPEELAAALEGEPPALVIVDLTTNGWDYDAIFAALERVPAASVLGYTTHALASATQPLHARCRRVVTKEALTKELSELLQRGLAA